MASKPHLNLHSAASGYAVPQALVEASADPVVEKVKAARARIASQSSPLSSPDSKSLHISPLKTSPDKSPKQGIFGADGSPNRFALSLQMKESATLAVRSLKGRLDFGKETAQHPSVSFSLSKGRVVESLDVQHAKRLKEKETLSESIREFFENMKLLKTSFHAAAQALVKMKSKEDISYKEFSEKVFADFVELVVSTADEDTLDILIQESSDNDVIRQKRRQIHGLMISLMKNLNDFHIKGVEKGKSISFWSGVQGQEMASTDPNVLSDSDIEAFRLLFRFWSLIKVNDVSREFVETKQHLISLIPKMLSYFYAHFAEGEVNVYLSSKPEGCDDTTLVADSAFLSTELPLLSRNKKVTKILVYLYNHKTSSWGLPIDFKSEDPKVLALKASLPTTVRKEARPISAGTVLAFASIWKKLAKEKRLLADTDC